MGCSLSLKTHYSGYHISGAALFSRATARIEKEFDPPLDDGVRMQYFSNVTASIFLSVAALESNINELYISTLDRDPNVVKGVETRIIDILQEIWPSLEKKPILEKDQT